MKVLLIDNGASLSNSFGQYLSEIGHEVSGLRPSLLAKETQNLNDTSEKLHSCHFFDLDSTPRLRELLRKVLEVDYVFFDASSFDVSRGLDPAFSWSVNTGLLQQIIQLQATLSFKLVFLSSPEIYGNFGGLIHEGITDRLEIRQQSAFALSCWAGEQLIEFSQTESHVHSTVLRLVDLYGSGIGGLAHSNTVCDVIRSIMDRRPIEFEPSTPIRPLYEDDCSRLLSQLIYDFPDRTTVNLGGEHRYLVSDLVEAVQSVFGFPAQWRDNYSINTGKNSKWEFDFALAQEVFDMAGSTSLADGISAIARSWHQRHSQ